MTSAGDAAQRLPWNFRQPVGVVRNELKRQARGAIRRTDLAFFSPATWALLGSSTWWGEPPTNGWNQTFAGSVHPQQIRRKEFTPVYMRCVEVRIDPESLPEMRRIYRERIIPTLQQVKGCLYVSLIEDIRSAGRCVSLTFWDHPADAESYEKGGLYAKLLEEISPYLAQSSEWRVHLSDDLTLQYEHVPELPVIRAFNLPAQQGSEVLPPKALHIRIVSPHIRQGMAEKFKGTYDAEILPALRAVDGCLYATLTENVREPGQFISLTIWETEGHAEHYEASGSFTDLIEKVKHMFTEAYQWKMQLERETGSKVISSEEMAVEEYSIVSARNVG